MITPAEILKFYESDFAERNNEEASTSQEDLRFLAKLNEGIKQLQDGHYEMPLPLKVRDRTCQTIKHVQSINSNPKRSV